MNKRRRALENIKENSASASHMCCMVSWNSFKKKSLEAAFEVGNLELQSAKQRERERNRSVVPFNRYYSLPGKTGFVF